MHLLLDTFNVLHAWRGGPETDLRGELAALGAMIRASRYRERKCTLVCDGARQRGVAGAAEGCRVIFAGPGKDADTLIERMIGRDPAAANLLLVSSDRPIQRAATRRRARPLPSPAFLAQLVRDGAAPPPPRPKPGTPLDREAVRSWLREFGYDAGLADLPRRTDRAARSAGESGERPERRRTAPPPRPIIDPRELLGPDLDDATRRELSRIDGRDLDMERWLGETDDG